MYGFAEQMPSDSSHFGLDSKVSWGGKESGTGDERERKPAAPEQYATAAVQGLM